MSLSDELRRKADGIWEAQHRHPFVRGIGDGTLAPERFRFWLRQDYLFLIEYARMQSLAAARAPDLETMTRFSALTAALLETEMDLHRSYSGELGISEAELEREEMAPTTQGYTDFLVRTAALCDFSELVAALLPCMWGYAEIGERLAAGDSSTSDHYVKWIEMYSSEEFVQLAAWCRGLMDRIGAGVSREAERRLARAFVTSSRWELAFWQMAWDEAGWTEAGRRGAAPA